MISGIIEEQVDDESKKPDLKAMLKSAMTAVWLVLIFVAIALMFSCVGSLFSVTPTVAATGYSVSADGEVLTIETMVYDSYRYAKAYKAEQEGD